jgi:deferrochelatase/peroxidase EfeB
VKIGQVQGSVALGKTPHFAHIRKANPHGVATDLGKPHDSLARMILRRGIPFGPPIIGVTRPLHRFSGSGRISKTHHQAGAGHSYGRGLLLRPAD